MRFLSIAIMPAIASGLLLATASGSLAQTRYETPPRAVLSGDLASPWILQLKRKPTHDGQSSHTVSRTRPGVRETRTYRERVYRDSVRPALRTVERKRPARVELASARPVPAKRPKPAHELDARFLPQMVEYNSSHEAGTLVVSTSSRYLYLVMGNGKARRYGVGVGKEGFTWSGKHKITRKAEWPGWTPPPEMIERERKKGRELPAHMEGGPENPLGARALYIGDTLYRIHGTNQPWTIGKAVSSGCIRMRNEDVTDLYDRISVGTKVVVQNG